mgnify:CR=1 FL=1|jgi:hypothetical protein
MKAAVAVLALIVLAVAAAPCTAQEHPAAAQIPAQEIAPPLPGAAPARSAIPAAPVSYGEKPAIRKIGEGSKELGEKTGKFFADTTKKTGKFFGDAGMKTGKFFKGLFVKE